MKPNSLFWLVVGPVLMLIAQKIQADGRFLVGKFLWQDLQDKNLNQIKSEPVIMTVLMDLDLRMTKVVFEDPTGVSQPSFSHYYERDKGLILIINQTKPEGLVRGLISRWLEEVRKGSFRVGNSGNISQDILAAEISYHDQGIEEYFNTIDHRLARELTIFYPSNVEFLGSEMDLLGIRAYWYNQFRLHVLEINTDKLDVNRRDPFYLNDNIYIGNQSVTSWKSWSSLIAINSDGLSLHLVDNFSEQLVEVSLSERVVFVEQVGQSSYLIDMDKELIYHKTHKSRASSSKSRLESGQTVADLSSVRRGDCSTIRLPWKLQTSDAWFELASSRRWQLIVGEPEHMIYIGKTRLDDSLLAHEFLLTYGNESVFPPLLMHRYGRNPTNISMFMAVTQGCNNLHGDFSQLKCLHELGPEILGFKLNDGSLIGIHDFKWHLSGLKGIDSFDLTECLPLTADLRLTSTWSGLVASAECRHSRYLDSYIRDTLNNLVTTYRPENSISVMRVSKTKEFLPGLDNKIEYEIMLVDASKSAFKFERITMATKDPPESDLLVRQTKRITLVECFGMASSFNFPDILVSYSPKKLECSIYKSFNCVFDPKINDGFQRYKRTIELQNHSDTKSQGNLEKFLSNNLDKINQGLQSLPIGARDCCLNENLQLRQITFSQLERGPKLKFKLNSVKMVQIDGYGYKQDSDSREISSSVSRSQCAQLCHSDPSCFSYSHCPRTTDLGSCVSSSLMLNYLGENKLDPRKVNTEAGCTIGSKDFSRFFHRTNLIEAHQLNMSIGYWIDESIESEQICAATCYKSDQCYKFVFCPKQANQSKSICYRKLGPKSNQLDQNANGQVQWPSLSDHLGSCILYDRLAISFYEKTNKSVADSRKQRALSQPLRLADVDQCAMACQGSPNCGSIHFCTLKDQIYSATIGNRHECFLVNHATQTNLQQSQAIERQQDPSRDCFHFQRIRSDQTEMSKSQADEYNQTKFVTFFSGLAIALLGIAFGIEFGRLNREKRRGQVYRDDDDRDEMCASFGDLVASCAT